MNITDKELHREIREFNKRQKLNIQPEMFFLWEYKLSNSNKSKTSIFNIIKQDNIYLSITDSNIVNINDLSKDEFFLLLKLYQAENLKLSKFVQRMSA